MSVFRSTTVKHPAETRNALDIIMIVVFWGLISVYPLVRLHGVPCFKEQFLFPALHQDQQSSADGLHPAAAQRGAPVSRNH